MHHKETSQKSSWDIIFCPSSSTLPQLLKKQTQKKPLRFVVMTGREWRERELEEGGQNIQTSSYKTNKY